MSETLVCAGCALLCDDATIAGDRLAPECPLGARWLAELTAADTAPAVPDALVDDAPIVVEAALARAAELLRGARRPLLHGFAGATVEDARAAVALADRIGAIAAPGPDGPWPGVPAFPLRGASTATLGEIRDRSELVVIWREDPETTHPRLLARLGLCAGGGDRRVLAVVDDRDTPTARLADVRLQWPAERDDEALATLHRLAREPDSSELGTALLGAAAPLASRLRSARHATVVYGPAVAGGPAGQRRELALSELVRELSHGRHVVTLALGGAPGLRGAGEVLTWQTGYPGPVDLSSGHPELVRGTEPIIGHERVDVTLRVGDDAAAVGDRSVAAIALSPRPGTPAPTVWIRTAAAGVGAGGTMHRLDGVPLALVPPRPSDAPAAAELLARLLEAVRG
jgi:formylmethanofuran dehydrogenase subunit B